MSSWAAVVIATAEAEGAPMHSRLPAFLHPIAGRPLIWHTVSALSTGPNPPAAIFVVALSNVANELFDDVLLEISTVHPDIAAEGLAVRLAESFERVMIVDAASLVRPAAITQLLETGNGSWIVGRAGEVVAGVCGVDDYTRLMGMSDPLAGSSELFVPQRQVDFAPLALRVTTRADLAVAHVRIRDRLVSALMEGGVTFVLPESVVIDVGAAIGRDSVIYPGVVIEGETTIGEETVVGPSCRIIHSWIGSGVELRGWNYIANTSIRNRAILEPYVRRGFE